MGKSLKWLKLLQALLNTALEWYAEWLPVLKEEAAERTRKEEERTGKVRDAAFTVVENGKQ